MRFRFDHAAKRGCIQRGTKIRAAFLVNNHRGLGSTDDRRLKRSDVWRNRATTMTALHYQFPRLCQRRPSGSKPCPVWAVLCHEWFSLYVPGQLQPAAAPSAPAAPLPQRCRWFGCSFASSVPAKKSCWLVKKRQEKNTSLTSATRSYKIGPTSFLDLSVLASFPTENPFLSLQGDDTRGFVQIFLSVGLYPTFSLNWLRKSYLLASLLRRDLSSSFLRLYC
jgi:hypothetical protein